MATIRKQILSAIVAALNTDTPAGVPQASQRRVNPYDAESEDFLAIDIAPLDEPVQPVAGRFGSHVTRTMTVAVRCWAAGDAPEVASDALVAWASKALEGNRLGGLCENITETRTTWNYQVGTTIFGVAEVQFDVEYRTVRGNQESSV